MANLYTCIGFSTPPQSSQKDDEVECSPQAPKKKKLSKEDEEVLALTNKYLDDEARKELAEKEKDLRLAKQNPGAVKTGSSRYVYA